MRVLGYSFREAHTAERARQLLSQRYQLRPEDTNLADLANDGWILAVRAREDNVAGVAQLLDAHGGEPLTDVDEAWTELRATH